MRHLLYVQASLCPPISILSPATAMPISFSARKAVRLSAPCQRLAIASAERGQEGGFDTRMVIPGKRHAIIKRYYTPVSLPVSVKTKSQAHRCLNSIPCRQ